MGKKKLTAELVQRIASKDVWMSKCGRWIEVELGEQTLRISLPKRKGKGGKPYNRKIDHGTVTFEHFDFGDPPPDPQPPAEARYVKTVERPQWHVCPTSPKPKDVTHTLVYHQGIPYEGQPCGGMAEGYYIGSAEFCANPPCLVNHPVPY